MKALVQRGRDGAAIGRTVTRSARRGRTLLLALVAMGITATVAAGSARDGRLEVTLIAPSATDDLAFTQGMAEALRGRDDVEVTIHDEVVSVSEAESLMHEGARGGADLVVAHGSQYADAAVRVAAAHPDVAFAHGMSGTTAGLANLSAYAVDASHSGYANGAIAAQLTTTGVVGVVAPIERGDARHYVEGVRAGVAAIDPAITLVEIFTESYSDLDLARQAAERLAASDADVMTGTSQMVAGAVEVAADRGVTWLGTQHDQAAMGPTTVVASQRYRWEIVVDALVEAVRGGDRTAGVLSLDEANAGIRLVVNPDHPLAGRVEDLARGVAAPAT